MSSTKQLNWWVDEREFNRFRDFVDEKHGVIDLCFSSEVMQAMRAYIDKDRATAVEDKLTTFEEVLVGVTDDFSRRRSHSEPLIKDDLGGENTVKIRCEIPAALKEEFSIYVDENSELRYGEALGRAMSAYRDGGREQRQIATLDDMIEAVQNTKVISGDSDTDESKPYRVEEKVAAIRKDIADENSKNSADEIEELPRPHLEESIHEHCTKGDRDEASDRTVNKYINHVTDDLGLTEHPKNDVLFIKNADMDGLAFEQKDFADLTTDERIEAVRVKLLCKAKPGTGAQVSAADIKSEFFDGEPSESVAHDLRNRAQEANGFGGRTGGDKKKKVYVDINDVTDKDLLEAAGMTTSTEKEEIEDKAKDEMDALINAQLVADGGSG